MTFNEEKFYKSDEPEGPLPLTLQAINLLEFTPYTNTYTFNIRLPELPLPEVEFSPP